MEVLISGWPCSMGYHGDLPCFVKQENPAEPKESQVTHQTLSLSLCGAGLNVFRQKMVSRANNTAEKLTAFLAVDVSSGP